MLCRNCNYILSGKENFCPNCGTMPYGQTNILPEKEQLKTEEVIKPVEEALFREEKNEKNISSANTEIFACEPELSEKDDRRKPGKNSAGKILILLFILCTLSVTAFGLADYFGITPSIYGFVQTLSQKSPGNAEKETETYRSQTSIREPEINFSMTTAYIMSGNGLTLRKGPGNGYAPLYSLTDLTQVQIFGGDINSPNWVYVYCPEKDSYGWLDGSYLASEKTIETTLEAQRLYTYEEIPENYFHQEEASSESYYDEYEEADYYGY